MAASPSQVRIPDPPAPVLTVLTEDLLAEVLIRLSTLADVGRACTVCVAFHRVISGHSFLRRLRAVHPPSLLGIMSVSFNPAEPPHPCATLARSIAAANFWCFFVPSSGRWSHRDFRDGRALLSAVPKGSGVRQGDYDQRALVREFAVSDPLHRRYLLLPTIPEDLTALVNQPDITWFNPFLAPSEQGEGGTSFRVICLAQCQRKLVLFIFSSISRSWHAAEFDGWRALIAESSNPAPGFQPELDRAYYAHGCFCWVMNWSHKLLVLDMRTIEFTAFDIKQKHPSGPKAIVEAGEGKFGMFTLFVDMEYQEHALLYTILQDDGKGTTWWRSEAFIPLPLNYHYNIMGVAGGYLLLQGIPEDRRKPNFDYFSLNLKTFQVQWFCETQNMIVRAPLFVGFPPSLSSPTV